MPSIGSLRDFTCAALPHAGPCAQKAARSLLVALMVEFTTLLSQLGRQTDRDTPAKGSRQFLARWLDRPHWDPPTVYSHLNRCSRRVLGRQRGRVALLADFTYLKQQWAVLQVSIPWQGRALPLYRCVTRRTDPEVAQTQAVLDACALLREHLPPPLGRYVLVMDRGFPSHPLIRALQEAGWEIVLRVKGDWRMTHPEYTGLLQDAGDGRIGPSPRGFGEATLGYRNKGKKRWSQANVVMYHGEGYQEPWFLVTTLRRAADAVAIYRQRMKIECEFRDLKGPFGLDELAGWQNRDRVARFLAMVALYEWRLALLWLKHRLHQWAEFFAVYGRLSWIRITREWIQRQLRLAAKSALDCL